MVIEGKYGPVKFVLDGPTDLVEAVVKFIRNLTRMYNNGG